MGRKGVGGIMGGSWLGGSTTGKLTSGAGCPGTIGAGFEALPKPTLFVTD